MSNSRKAFEAWVRLNDLEPTHVLPSGDYIDLEDQAAWRAWQHQQARIDESERQHLQFNEERDELLRKMDERIAKLGAERDHLRDKVIATEQERESERNALAAHVERLQERFSPAPWPMENQPDGSMLPVDPAEYFGTPQTSLAQRDARMRVDGIDWMLGIVGQALDEELLTDVIARRQVFSDVAEGGK